MSDASYLDNNGFYEHLADTVERGYSIREAADYLYRQYPEQPAPTPQNVSQWLSQPATWKKFSELVSRDKLEILWSRDQMRRKNGPKKAQQPARLEDMLAEKPARRRASTPFRHSRT